MGTVNRIVFTGDFLRPAVGDWRPTQHENINWLAQVLRVPVQMATGLPSEIVHWDNNWINGSRLESSTVAAIYDACWLPRKISSWAQIFAAETLPDVVEDLFRHLFCGSYVIGFELPPYLTRFLTRQGIGFIDCSISPVRFMDDLLIEVSSDSAEATGVLKRYRVSEELMRLQAGVLTSHVAKSYRNPPLPRTLLLLMQTSFDKVVIEHGRFSTMLDHLETLGEVVAQYDALLIKEHPLESQAQVVETLKAIYPRARVTTENFYRLVGHHNVAAVTALSSSAVLEAGYFGKTGHYLLPGYEHGAICVGIEGVSIDDAILMPDFWRDVLSAAGLMVTERDGLRLQSKTNRFRQQLHSAWGYNQIDTDIPVRWAQG